MRSKRSASEAGGPADEGVPHERLDRPGPFAERRRVGLDPPPAQERLPFLGDDPLEELLPESLRARRRGEVKNAPTP